jgi:hypothetical protein
MPAKSPPIPPLFKADSATLTFYGSKDGKVSVSYQGWDAAKVAQEGQVFEVSRSGGQFRARANGQGVMAGVGPMVRPTAAVGPS